MTVDEVIAAGPSWTRRWRSSAAGGYQFMNATLKGLKKELGLRGSQVMDPDLQDRLAFHLLRRRGYEEFMRGQISRTEFGKRLAMEWASFPVLASTQGSRRHLSRGQSYYEGDALNHALVEPEVVEAVLDRAKALGNAVPAAPPVAAEPTLPSEPPPVVVEPVLPGDEDYDPTPAPIPEEPRVPEPVDVDLEEDGAASSVGFWVIAGVLIAAVLGAVLFAVVKIGGVP